MQAMDKFPNVIAVPAGGSTASGAQAAGAKSKASGNGLAATVSKLAAPSWKLLSRSGGKSVLMDPEARGAPFELNI